MFATLNCIRYSAHPYITHWPKIVFTGDPYQRRSTTGCQLPGPYYYIKRFSFLERMAPECAQVICGRNDIPTVKLNTQYRIIPAICDLSNAMSHRIVRTQLPPVSHACLTVSTTSSPTSFLYDSLMRDLRT